MDVDNFEEFHCAVCFELFGEGLTCPRILSCGHCFCHSCLQELINSSPFCPTCKDDITVLDVTSIPINFPIRSILLRLNGKSRPMPIWKEEESITALPLPKKQIRPKFLSEGFCNDHEKAKELRCMECKLWLCAMCVVLNHKQCRTLLVTDALEEMKSVVLEKVQSNLDFYTMKNCHANEYLEIVESKLNDLKKSLQMHQLQLRKKIYHLEGLQNCIAEVNAMKNTNADLCDKMKILHISIENSSNDFELMKCSLEVDNFLEQSQEMKYGLSIPRQCQCHISKDDLLHWTENGYVYAARKQNNKTEYSKLVVKDDHVWLYKFNCERPYGNPIIISFREVLYHVGGSTDLPRRGFLELRDVDGNTFDVVIIVDEKKPRSTNFLILCSGFKQYAFKGVDYRWGNLFYFGAGVQPAVVKGTSKVTTNLPLKEGFVYGSSEPYCWFAICEKDDSDFVPIRHIKFGQVESGLPMLKKAREQKKILRIQNYGLVIA